MGRKAILYDVDDAPDESRRRLIQIILFHSFSDKNFRNLVSRIFKENFFFLFFCYLLIVVCGCSSAQNLHLGPSFRNLFCETIY